MGRASKNFSCYELQCKGCYRAYCEHPDPICNLTDRSLDKLQKLRDLCGVPLTINSACRCKEHNVAVGGRNGSKHVASEIEPSCAFDIALPDGFSAELMADYAWQVGFRGIGLYSSFVHVDDREQTAEWNRR